MTSLTITAAPQAPASPPQGELKQRITGKVRVAIEAMVWQGLPRAQAAESAGMTEHGLYKALRKPPVRAAYLHELDVLRTSERARNIHALVEVRDQRDNQMARVNAAKALEQMDDQQVSSAARATTPGLVIVIEGAPVTGYQRQIEAKPLIAHDMASEEG